jgi:uncharacterized membrane protein (DUF2068 family)
VNEVIAEPKILRRPTRIRYLKLIAVFKMLQGLLLLVLGFSLLFINGRPGWLDAISDWTSDELLLLHSRPIVYLLNKLQNVVEGGNLRGPALLALFYSAILFTEGIGVYLQKRWAELLMIFATAALIPLEARHLWYAPSVVAFAILVVNCFIVWFLYRVLRRSPPQHHAPLDQEVAARR